LIRKSSCVRGAGGRSDAEKPLAGVKRRGVTR
jgi:hypothetical protein